MEIRDTEHQLSDSDTVQPVAFPPQPIIRHIIEGEDFVQMFIVVRNPEQDAILPPTVFRRNQAVRIVLADE